MSDQLSCNQKCPPSKIGILAGILLITVIITSLVTWKIAHQDCYTEEPTDQISQPRAFTINEQYDISEIRINIDVTNHPTVNARNNLLTLGFDPNLPIDYSSEFLARYVDAETGDVVESQGQDKTYFAGSEDLSILLAKIEQYRLQHTGQALVFDSYGHFRLLNLDQETVYSGGYLWGGYTLSVVVLNPDSSPPRYDSRNFLFFSNNEEIMQGTGCARIIVREKTSVRSHGSIEFPFGTRCPLSPAPTTN